MGVMSSGSPPGGAAPAGAASDTVCAGYAPRVGTRSSLTQSPMGGRFGISSITLRCTCSR